MFFKIVTRSKKLPDLSSDIIEGNTILGSTLDIADKNSKFFEMIKNGGFDIIIGNPPYVKDNMINYAVNSKVTRSCGNTYAYFLEKSISMLKQGGRLGYIVPVSAISTETMEPLQKYLIDSSSVLYISNYDDRPAKLFEGQEHSRSSIILLRKRHSDDSPCTVYTTGYNRWYTKNAAGLFKNLNYIENPYRTKNCIPKLGNDTELKIWQKLSGLDTASRFITKKSEHRIIYHNSPQYWIHGLDFTAYNSKFKISENSEHNKILYLKERKIIPLFLGVLNSSLFYWFFIKTSNCRDLNPAMIGSFPLNSYNDSILDKMSDLCSQLMKSYLVNSVVKTSERKKGGNGGIAKTSYREIYPKNSKALINSIDDLLFRNYALKTDEIKYIKEFDLCFRMGKKPGQ